MITFSKADYMKEVENGYITRREHPADKDVVILNYTDLAVYERRWNDITLSSRGLIINEATGEVLARPFKKFFNFGEWSEMDKLIPKNEEPEVTVKHDGSLGILYRLNNKVCWSTRGSFESEQAKIAQEIWDRKYSHLNERIMNHYSDYTLLVEIIHPETRVVVDYEGQEDLVLIGAIQRETGCDLSHWSVKALAKELGMPYTKRVWKSVKELVEMKSNISANEEGWVLRWLSNGLRLKVKGDDYMAVHRVMYGISDKKKMEYWMTGKMEELIQKVPEEFRDEIEATQERLDKIYQSIYIGLVKLYDLLIKQSGTDRKEFALAVKTVGDKRLHAFLFEMREGKEPSIKKAMYKSYKEYI